MLVRLAREKHSSLLDPFVSYEENEVTDSQHFIFFVTYKWSQ
jgi:hypothetical protein